jgi:TolB protein
LAGPSRPGLRISFSIALLLACTVGAACGWIGTGRKADDRPPVPARVAYVADDGHVYVVPLAGGDAHRVSQIAGLVPGETATGHEVPTRWPTWAPDASRLAFVRVLIGPGDMLIASQLWTVAHDGSDLRKVWEAPDQEPIYLAWSPNGVLIALLVQTEDDLELVIVDTSGVESPRRLAKGNPFYFTWSSDSRSLLLHVGDARSPTRHELTIARVGPPDEFRSLGVAPGDFRTPGWSADGGKVAFVEDGPDGVATISVVSPQGGDVARLATPPGQTAFALSVDGARLAWAGRSEADRVAYDGLEVVSTDGRRRTRVTNDLVVAFFWSPDDRRLAYITLDRGAQTFIWYVADADGNNSRRLSTFTPSLEQIRELAFFDQYAISHGLWSPDSSALVYAVGQPGDQRAVGALSPGTIQTVPADGSAGPRMVIGGSFVALPVPAP